MNQVLHGIYVGVVDSNGIDKEGQIKIVINAISAKVRSARLATPYAGDQRGMQFSPEKGDQVVVAFEQGLVGDPIVIGSLWSNKSKPQQPHDDAKNNVKLIRTRGGNEIRFSDEDGKESITISSPDHEIFIKGKKITLDGEVLVTKKLVVGAGPKTTIEGNQITGAAS